MDRLRQNITRLKSPHQTLNPEIFDEQNVMLPEMRYHLIWQVQNVFDRFLSCFPGVILEDICLCGSSTSYLWRPEGDFDVMLRVKIDRKRFFIKQEKAANYFLNRYFTCCYNNHRYRLNGKKIDVILKTKELPQKYGVYSLLQNKWLSNPIPDLCAGLDADGLYTIVTKWLAKIKERLKTAPRDSEGKISIEELKKIRKYHKRIVKQQYKDPKGHMIIKLLRYEGLNDMFYWFFMAEFVRALSVTSPAIQEQKHE